MRCTACAKDVADGDWRFHEQCHEEIDGYPPPPRPAWARLIEPGIKQWLGRYTSMRDVCIATDAFTDDTIVMYSLCTGETKQIVIPAELCETDQWQTIRSLVTRDLGELPVCWKS